MTVETQHVHANKEVIDCNIAFSLAIRDLIRGESSEKAYQNMKAFALTSRIKEWQTELELGDLQVVTKQIGWVKIAFQQSFLHLCKCMGFRDAMKAVISQ